MKPIRYIAMMTAACLALTGMTAAMPSAPIAAAAYSAAEAETEVIGDFVIEDGVRLVEYKGTDKRSITIPAQVKEIGVACFFYHAELVEVILPEQLQTIEQMAFWGCGNLERIVIPDSVTELGQLAFVSCAALTKMDLSSTAVQSLGEGTFMNCTGLKEIALPDTLLTIGKECFKSCTNLKTGYTGTGLERIESTAFEDCTALEQLALPDTVQYIDPTAFSGCDDFVAAHTENDAFAVSQILIRCDTSDYVYKIPEGIVSIVNNAFEKSKALEVICPDSLRYIRADAFADNSAVIDVRLNEGCISIGENAFSDCRLLTELTIPAAVSEIGVQTRSRLTDIYGTRDTAAEQFADENNLRFHDVNEPQIGRDLTLDYAADGWYFGNSTEAFGGEYYLTDADRQRLIDLGFNPTDVDTEWNGSCIGLSVTVILAKNGVFSPAMLQSGAQSLAAVEPTEEVLSFINYYQCIQGRDGTSQSWESAQQMIYRLQAITKNVKNGASPCLLTFTTQTGSHGVVAYAQEAGEWTFGGKSYDARILVWDSNYPAALHEESCLYYNTETFAHCIPQYGVGDDADGDIISVYSELNVLNAYPYPLGMRGDVDGDSEITAIDAQLVLQAAAEVMAGNDSGLTPAQLAAVDIDGDGEITVVDAQLILNYYANVTLGGLDVTWEDIISGKF